MAKAKGAWDSLSNHGINRGAKKPPKTPYGKDLFDRPMDPTAIMTGLKKEFIFPPFTILSARDGGWMDRKHTWLKLGIESELGRGEDLTYGAANGATVRYDTFEKMDIPEEEKTRLRQEQVDKQRRISKGEEKYNPKKANAFRTGSPAMGDDWDAYRNKETATAKSIHATERYDGAINSVAMAGVSIFDPVLTELMYKWFCPLGGQILDPFAGGSVRGVVASVLGYHYHGNDLSARQVEANRVQAKRLCPEATMPVWSTGDSTRIRRLVPEGFQADMGFSCPPYADLEVYSDDPADISNMPYEQFLEGYRKIIHKSCSLLKDNRFFGWVIGEVRDKRTKGSCYHGVVLDTVQAFRDAGLGFYNDAILVTSVGSLPIRTRRAFSATRKLGRSHQNVLVFVKGDPAIASKTIEESHRA